MCIYIPDTMQGHSLGMQPAENVHIVILRNRWNPLGGQICVHGLYHLVI